MTNKEKFKEVFGFEVDPDLLCIASTETCESINKITQGIECKDCPFYKGWTDAEYKPCFELKEVKS